MTASSLADVIAGSLSPYLGEFNAKIAVKTFAKRAFDIAPEELTIEHMPGFLEALEPMLNTLAGRAATEAILERIEEEVAIAVS